MTLEAAAAASKAMKIEKELGRLEKEHNALERLREVWIAIAAALFYNESNGKLDCENGRRLRGALRGERGYWTNVS